ncbi:MAG: hypothetical protein MUC38_00365 [Cyclobacteriaceae bacterium]|jgi:hypothetical protein|nr:hypothetical protein [Cyclobacteriaceae bacterium]
MMFQQPRVVFPFAGNKISLEAFAWAKELAAKVHLPFYVFCSLLPENLFSKIHIYHEMLEADGYYFTHYSGHPSEKTHIRIKTGDFRSNFRHYLNRHPNDIIVVDPLQDFSGINNPSGLMGYPNGIIFLRQLESSGAGEDVFSHILDTADVYHLPPGFHAQAHRKPHLASLFLSLLGRHN